MSKLVIPGVIAQSGNGGGGGSVTVDSALSTTSKNPVQNKVITNALEDVYTQENLVAGTNVSITETSTAYYNVSNFSGSNYITLAANKFAKGSYAWSFTLRVQTPPASVGDVSGNFLGSPSPSGWMRIGLGSSCDTNNGKCRFALGLSTNGTAWNIGYEVPSTYDLNLETWYWLKFSYNGSDTYKLQVSTDGVNFTDYVTKTYSGALYTGSNYLVQIGTNSSAADAYKGIVDMRGVKIVVNNVTTFDGSTAVASTDFTVNGSPTISQSSGQTYYQINNTQPSPDLSSYLQNKTTARNSLLLSLKEPESATGTNSVLIANDTGIIQKGSYSVAVGSDQSAYYNSIVSIGYGARASSDHSIAIGRGSSAMGASSAGKSATAIGNYASANHGTSIGAGTKSQGKAIVLGCGNGTSDTDKVIAEAYKAIVIGVIGATGELCKATAQEAIQLGNGSNANAKTLQVYEYQLLDGNTGKIPAERLPVKHRFCTEGKCGIDKSVIPWLSTNQAFVFTFSFRTPPLKNFANGQAIVITGNTHYDIGFEFVMDWEDASETKARIGVGLTTANSSWNLGWSWSEYSLETLTWYKVRLTYDLTKYTVEYAPDNSDSWTTIKEVTSSDKLYCNSDIFLTQQSSSSANTIWKYGEVDINSFKATSGNTTYIDGVYSLRNLITLPTDSSQVKEYYEIG